MIKRIMAIILLSAAVSLAQGTSTYHIVQTGGPDLVWLGGGATNLIAQGITNYFSPSFGTLKAQASPFLLASNVVVTNGTITSGTVTNTWDEDGSYLVVNESGVWAVYYLFTNSTVGICPRILDFHGRYEGNAPHNVKFSALDWTTGGYSNFTASVDDLPSGTLDTSLQFQFPQPTTNYCNATSGAVYVRAIHVGSAVGSHNFYTDFIQLTYATAVATNAGTWYPLYGFAVSQSNNISINGMAGTITTIPAGSYEWAWYVSFTGQTNTEFNIQHLTNGIPSSTKSIRTIGRESSIGSMSAFGGGYQPSGTTNSWQFNANTDGAWISFVNGAAKVKKEAN